MADEGSGFILNSHYLSQSEDRFVDSGIEIIDTVGAIGGCDLKFSTTSDGATASTCMAAAEPVGSVTEVNYDELGSKEQATVTVTYTVKIISPHASDGVQLRKWDKPLKDGVSKFSNLQDLKAALATDFSEFIKEDDFGFGFIQPGHGSKGRQISLNGDNDIENMYSTYKGKKQIILWVKVLKRKRVRPSTGDTASKKQCQSSECAGSNYQSHLQSLSEVEVIVEKLTKMHEGSYSSEQLRAWAHMIHLHKHASYDEPPSKPFFKSSKKKQVENTVAVSPGKRIKYRSECINQLEKWHSLLEKGVISTDQFTELHGTIMNDIKQF